MPNRLQVEVFQFVRRLHDAGIQVEYLKMTGPDYRVDLRQTTEGDVTYVYKPVNAVRRVEFPKFDRGGES